jgi:hypothetical protein
MSWTGGGSAESAPRAPDPAPVAPAAAPNNGPASTPEPKQTVWTSGPAPSSWHSGDVRRDE